MAEELDPQGPWNIRAISIRLREAIALRVQAENLSRPAAEKLTVGDWLERELRWVLDGRPNPRGPAPARVSSTLETTSALVRAALEIAAVSAARQRDPLVRTARATVRAQLLASRPNFRPRPPLAAIQGPERPIEG